MEKMILNVKKVKQPIGEFYITTLDSKKLYSMAKADIVKISSQENLLYEGLQRSLNRNKVEKIQRYLKLKDATFPNSIILNIPKDKVTEVSDNQLEITVDENSFSIIDGQHRLEGLKNFSGDFELAISIFIGLSKEEQSRIFVTINSEQTKVNPSLSVYQESEDYLLTPRKFASQLAIYFATDPKSKWYKEIKIIGVKDDLSEDALISLSAFYKPILSLIYDDDYYFDIRNSLDDNNNNLESLKLEYADIFRSKYILWDFYINSKHEELYKIISNYFNSIATNLPNDWVDKESMLKKTTGYNAMMLLFVDLFKIGMDEGDLTKKFFDNKLKNLKKLDGLINSKNYSASGTYSSRALYQEFIKKIQ